MDTQNKAYENKEKPVVLLIFCLISTVLLLYISYFSVFPVMEPMGLAALGVFCGCYSVLLRKGSFLMCILAPAVSTAVISFAYSPVGFNSVEALVCIINLVFAFALSAAANACADKKSSFGVSFAVLSVTATLYICALLLAVVYDTYKSLDAETVKQAINDAAAFMGKSISTLPSELLLQNGAELPSEYMALLADYGKTIELSFKLTFPSMLAIAAMAAAALINVLYKPFAKVSGMTMDCLDGRVLTFELSGVSAILFELVYFAYIIMLLFSQNTVLNTAFMNLVSVLTVPFAYIGLRHLVRLLAKKMNSKVAAVSIVAMSAFCLVMLLGGSILTFAALIGSSSINKAMLDKKSE